MRAIAQVAALAAVLALLLSSPKASLAAGEENPYPPGGIGYDLSWPQCDDTLDALSFDFAIIGVTGGRAFTQNPCLGALFRWASSAPTAPSLYMNLNYPAGSTATNGLRGPMGECRRSDKACQAYNYGYNAAQYALAYAASQGASARVWWLDIETTNTWSKRTELNALVIQGAIDYLQEQGRTVGIYSTRRQWGIIAGDFSPGLPIWVAGAGDLQGAQARCADPTYWFAGGTPWLVQFPLNGYGGDYACHTG